MKAKSKIVYTTFAWLIVFGFFPLILVALASVLSSDSVHLVKLPFTVENYKKLFSSTFAIALLRSFNIATITTLLCLLIAYPFSYILARAKHKSLLLILIIIPFWTSSLIRTYALIAILKYKGILNAFLMKLHLIHTPLSLLYTHFAVISGLVYNLLPFMVLPIYTNMERFDFRLMDAAKDLGASKFDVFFRVFLPNTTRGIVSGILMVFLPAMTLFYIPNILGGARSLLLGNLIQNQFFTLQNWPQGAATSTFLTLILLAFLGVFKAFNRKGAL